MHYGMKWMVTGLGLTAVAGLLLFLTGSHPGVPPDRNPDFDLSSGVEPSGKVASPKLNASPALHPNRYSPAPGQPKSKNVSDQGAEQQATQNRFPEAGPTPKIAISAQFVDVDPDAVTEFGFNFSKPALGERAASIASVPKKRVPAPVRASGKPTAGFVSHILSGSVAAPVEDSFQAEEAGIYHLADARAGQVLVQVDGVSTPVKHVDGVDIFYVAREGAEVTFVPEENHSGEGSVSTPGMAVIDARNLRDTTESVVALAREGRVQLKVEGEGDVDVFLADFEQVPGVLDVTEAEAPKILQGEVVESEDGRVGVRLRAPAGTDLVAADSSEVDFSELHEPEEDALDSELPGRLAEKETEPGNELAAPEGPLMATFGNQDVPFLPQAKALALTDIQSIPSQYPDGVILEGVGMVAADGSFVDWNMVLRSCDSGLCRLPYDASLLGVDLPNE